MYIPINEVYFASKQACAKRASERERERERGREREKERQAWQEFQDFESTRCTSSPSKSVQSEREREREGGASMSRIPINEVYFVSINEVYCVSKHVKNVTPYLL